MSVATKRLMKELNDIKNSVHSEISENISASPIDGNLFEWNAIIIGATDTPYEGGIFHIALSFPQTYPFTPPIVRFKTKIFHPNISESGEICLDILKYHWSPAYSIPHILLSIVSLLSDPNFDDPLNMDSSNLYKTNIDEYNSAYVGRLGSGLNNFAM